MTGDGGRAARAFFFFFLGLDQKIFSRGRKEDGAAEKKSPAEKKVHRNFYTSSPGECSSISHGLRIPAFAPAHAVRVVHPLMTGVSSLAAACLEEECSVDTVQSLVAELTIEAERLSREGTKTSKEQVEALLMLGRLQALSQNPAANQGEIEKIVSGMARSFGTVKDYDFPGSALGYTGTPNKNKVGLD